LGEFARLGRAGSVAEDELEDFRGKEDSAVTADFGHILAGKTRWCLKAGYEDLIDHFFAIENLSKRGRARFWVGRLGFKNSREDFLCVRSRDANHSDGSLAGRRGHGGDGFLVGRH
jgi:hypothetical protein